MHFEGEYIVNAPREQVWNYISDPRNALEYVPNIKKLEVLSEDRFNATVSVGVGGIKGTFNLEFQILENISPNDSKIKASGEGIRSVVHLETKIDVSDTPDGKTLMKWMADGSVGGLIAGVGQRLLRMVANKMLKEGFEQLRSKLEK